MHSYVERSFNRNLKHRLNIVLQVRSIKPILPPLNWPQQSTFETWRHNHFKCCTTSKLKPLF